MSVVLLLWRSRLRSSWRTGVALMVLIGLGGAVTLAVAAGARRTASSNDDFLEAADASEVATSFDGRDPDKAIVGLRSVPEVSAVDVWVGFNGTLQGAPAAITNFFGFWSDLPAVDRPFITAGRLPTGPTEALVTEVAARRARLRVGSKVQLVLADASFTDYRPVEADIVGIGIFPGVHVEDEVRESSILFFSRAFSAQHLDLIQFASARLKLSRRDIPSAAAGLAALGKASGGEPMLINEYQDQGRHRIQQALQPLVWALSGLAGLAGVATVLTVAQALSRTLRRRRTDDQSLLGIGCTIRQLVATDLAYAAAVVGGGTLLAVGLAVGASALFPVGPLGRIEAIRGVEVDLPALAVGSLAIGAAILGLVGVGSWRRRTRPGPAQPGRAPGPLGARAASSTGTRLVTGRRGTVSTVAGVAAGLGAVVAALTFTGSLDHLVENPELVGMSWDVIAREGYTRVDVPATLAAAQAEPLLRRVSGVTYLDGAVNGVTTAVAEVHPILGDPWPPVVSGRAPRSASEILVGTKTLRSLGLRTGDEVTITLASRFNDLDQTAPAEPRTFRIVGSAVAPALGLGGFDTPRLDVGVLLPEGAYQQMHGEDPSSDIVLFDLDPDAPPSAIIDRFPDGLPDERSTPTEWFTSAAPGDVRQAGEAIRVIWLAVVALAATVVATIAHTLLGFVRQRRRDYAVLKALGFTRGQVRATVLWQSGTILAVALVAALPLGAAAGRWLWTGFAERIGVVPEPVVPLALLAAAVAVSIVAVQGATLVPASLAGRTSPGRTLHGE